MQANRLTPQLLQKKAVVYIRQSTLEQVQSNLESQRRQYQLADHARRLGFAEVVVLDDDLGRSGSGYVERPGFVKLIELICTGEVGAVFALEASRLARNGRDWHHIVELCGFYGVILVDGEGSYDPTQYNDRLLLGLKGSLSEFELGLLRQRLMEAIFQKAQRGELRFAVPMGYSWPPDSAIEFEPDRRVKETIELVFRQFREFGSARQLLLHWRKQQLQFPTPSCVGGRQLSFGPPTYRQIISVLKNPFYAGAYVYGKSEARIEMVNGRPRKVYGHDKPINRWSVVIKDHHPAYITWEQYERNQVLLAENAFQRSTQGRKSGRGGSALLTGLLRCRRCGRMLGVGYSGAGRLLRYSCRGGQLNRGTPPCLTFGGLDVDRVVSQELLRAVQPMAVEASFRAEKLMSEQREAALGLVKREWEQAQYEATLAARRYEAVDPSNRLVAAQLEERWNAALVRVRELEERLEQRPPFAASLPAPGQLAGLAANLQAVWENPRVEGRLRQRLLRLAIDEVVVDVDDAARQIVLVIHWKGGRHTERRVDKRRSGHTRYWNDEQVLVLIAQMAGRWSDEHIAAHLNRLGSKTGKGNTWTAERVESARRKRGIPAYFPRQEGSGYLTLSEAASKLGVSHHAVRKLIKRGLLEAHQVMPDAPWQIPVAALTDEMALRARSNAVGQKSLSTAQPRLPGL